MQWFPGAERINGNSAGGYHGLPFRIVLHTTEGSSIAGAVGAYKANNSWPHLTVDPRLKRIVQHVPLTSAARALRNTSGGVQTNFANAIQIEIIGKAGTSHDWPGDQLDWLGNIVGDICRAFGIGFTAPAFVGTESGTIATVYARQRMSQNAWNSFSGVCGHQHVPENSHWDPGRINITRILQTAAKDVDVVIVGPAPTPAPSNPAAKADWQGRLKRKATIRRGDKGHDVKLLQALLATHSADQVPNASWIDGDFGGLTFDALKTWQGRTKSLNANGICNGDTWAWMVGDLPTQRKGADGHNVKVLQSLLYVHATDLVEARVGKNIHRWIDGDFGAGTDYVLRTWQARTRVLRPDGVAGLLTNSWLAGV